MLNSLRLNKLSRLFAVFIFELAVLVSAVAIWNPLGVGHTRATSSSSPVLHYEYVFPNGGMDVYDMDHGFKLIKQVSLPTTAQQRGAVFSPSTHALYVSYGNDGSAGGQMLKYDVLTDTIVWTQTYSHGIDSMAITPDGQTIYMPDGELSQSNLWYVVDANTGKDTGTTINAGLGPHNTIVSLNGKHVYMAPRNYNYLVEADTSTNQVIQNIGPLSGGTQGSGVRPFTINGAETVAYMSMTGYLGFVVGSITTGKILYYVPIQGFTWDGSGPSDPSHGISLSPDEKELYVVDQPNSYVHVFDVSGVPNSPPVQIANIQLTRPMTGDETPCTYDCLRSGWLQHSLDGRFVFVGDSGDVISTATRTAVTNLDPMYNTKVFLEIDWQNGVPIATSTRYGMGYVTGSTATPTPTPTNTPTTTPTPTNTPTPTLTPCPTPTTSNNTYRSAVLADKPAIYYRLDESCGTTAADSSGSGHNGTYTSNASLGQPGATSDGDTCISGSGRLVQYTGAGLPSGSTARSVEVWYKSTATPSSPWGSTLVAWGTESNTNLFALKIYSSTKLKLTNWQNNYYFTVPSGVSLIDGKWHYVVATFDGSNATVYLDGQSLGSQTASFNTVLNSAGLVLGISVNADSSYSGWLDEVAIYSYALSATQIQAHYSSR